MNELLIYFQLLIGESNSTVKSCTTVMLTFSLSTITKKLTEPIDLVIDSFLVFLHSAVRMFFSSITRLSPIGQLPPPRSLWTLPTGTWCRPDGADCVITRAGITVHFKCKLKKCITVTKESYQNRLAIYALITNLRCLVEVLAGWKILPFMKCEITKKV